MTDVLSAKLDEMLADLDGWVGIYSIRPDTMRQIITLAKQALSLPITAEPGVKPLEWADWVKGGFVARMNDPLEYSIANGTRHFRLYIGGHEYLGAFDSADEAKAAAFEHYRGIILSTITAEPGWTRQDLAEGLALLDNVKLQHIASSVGPEDDANNWREYLGRADDLLVHLSLCSVLASPKGMEVSVKPLEWVKSNGVARWTAQHPLGQFEITQATYLTHKGPQFTWQRGICSEHFYTLEAAKAAAFEHYSAVILSAITSGKE